jgi:hypothetical protein
MTISMPTFNETLDMIDKAKQLFELTDDVMFREAIKVLSPLLAEEGDADLTIQQQTALTYLSRSMDQYNGLFGPARET